MWKLDHTIIDLFCSDLIVDRVKVDIGEEGGQGDQQGNLKRKSQTQTFTFTSRESKKSHQLLLRFPRQEKKGSATFAGFILTTVYVTLRPESM